ncbi:MAG: DUF3109 family protein [Flavobacteriia bacterium]|nr:DUF3109 family protein [Flavobacteriia bacterium]
MLFEVQNKMVSSEIFSRYFSCDYKMCKGACCVEGNGGAPINEDEMGLLELHLDKILPYIHLEGKRKIEKDGFFYSDWENEKATQLVHGKNCVFSQKTEEGTIVCGIELAFLNNKIPFNKPISCQLYPIRVQNLKNGAALNYHEWDICKAAILLGEKNKIPVYQFLKNAIINAFGEEFYKELELIDVEWQEYSKKPPKQ